MGILRFVILGMVILAMTGVAAADDDKGAEKMTLHAGERGDVLFNHREHQTALGDCNICHTLFPQKENGIEEMIKQGKLESKQVMNSLCTNCHKEKKKAGLNAGPVTCSKCHTAKE